MFACAGNAGQDAGADQAAELHQPSESQLVQLCAVPLKHIFAAHSFSCPLSWSRLYKVFLRMTYVQYN
jgi:hypothetical protein